MKELSASVWQLSGGPADRPYADVFLHHGVGLIGPGESGPWTPGRRDTESTGFVRRLAEEMKPGDLVLLRTASDTVVAVGLTRRGIVAQRLKRFGSVMRKLLREPQMKLSQMQDLGGCRAIVQSVEQVRDLEGRYLAEREGQEMRCYDYISTPKADGYRGIHMVGRYAAKGDAQEVWNGQRIEIQLRSGPQHAFATAVETVTTFLNSPLKFGGGTPAWRRFFALMGTAIAEREKTPPVPGTPTDKNEMIGELRDLEKQLKVRDRLASWSSTLRRLPKSSTSNAKWFLLVLDPSANTVSVTGFVSRQSASKAYIATEQSSRSTHTVDAVLVSVYSINELRRAYPNYYSDTKEFVKTLDAITKGWRRKNGA